MIDIENCPFCGSANIAVGYHGQPAQTFHMRCVSCGAAGPTVSSTTPTGGAFPVNVCESWNRRTVIPQAPAAPEGQAEAIPDAFMLEHCGGEYSNLFFQRVNAERYIKDNDMEVKIVPLYRSAVPRQAAVGEDTVVAKTGTQDGCDAAMRATPADVPTRLDLVMLALTRARSVAMRNTVEARIPECGDFGSIAQDLDWAIGEMERATLAAAAPVRQHDARRPALSMFATMDDYKAALAVHEATASQPMPRVGGGTKEEKVAFNAKMDAIFGWGAPAAKGEKL